MSGGPRGSKAATRHATIADRLMQIVAWGIALVALVAAGILAVIR